MEEEMAASKREAFNQLMSQRRQDILDDREKHFESRKENTLLRQDVLDKFDQLEMELTKDLELVAGIDKNVESQVKIGQALDKIVNKQHVMNVYLAESASNLTNFETRRLQEKADKFNEKFVQIQDKLQPKKKFGFKGRKSKKTETKIEIVTKKPTTTSTTTPAGNFHFQVEDKSNQDIVVTPENSTGKGVTIDKMTNCKIFIYGLPSTLHMTNLTNCTVISLPVGTSIYIDMAENSTFVLACQQSRIHTCAECNFYLHVTSKAIIEDCKNVQFAPFQLDCQHLDKFFQEAGLCQKTNNWDKIDDFNWLASDKPSPNWKLLPAQSRRTFKLPQLTENN